MMNLFGRIRKARRRHPVFPDVPDDFWHGFSELWGPSLEQFEEAISLTETFGSDPHSPRFRTLDDAYWVALRSLHSRICLHARAVLALLANGLTDPAQVQWRVCHEASILALFLAMYPERAELYLRYSVISKNRLAQSLVNIDHFEAPTDDEASELEELSNSEKQALTDEYGRKPSSDYGWSGFTDFRKIEEAVESGWAWKARPQYIYASGIAHASANAGRPVSLEDGREVFLVGATNSGLTDPMDLTCLSLTRGTVALLQNASAVPGDDERLRRLLVLGRSVGALSWIVDPAVRCRNCDGYVDGAFPPEELPPEIVPPPCGCSATTEMED